MEDHVTYGIEQQDLPSYLEKVQSQLPALQLLVQMGWQYLPPEECVRLREGRLGTAILEPVLTEFIRRNARFEFKGQVPHCTEDGIPNAVLTAADEEIDASEAKTAALERQKKGLMQKLLTGEVRVRISGRLAVNRGQ